MSWVLFVLLCPTARQRQGQGRVGSRQQRGQKTTVRMGWLVGLLVHGFVGGWVDGFAGLWIWMGRMHRCNKVMREP